MPSVNVSPFGLTWKAKDRFLKSISSDASGCWLWSANGVAKGYGQLSFRKRKILAHRISYELHKGEIPSGMLVLHKCDVPACVNPSHLFIGTHADNIHDCMSKGRYRPTKKKTHCKKGHEFSANNTFIKYNGTQSCKRCRSDSQLAYKARNLDKVRAYQKERARRIRSENANS